MSTYPCHYKLVIIVCGFFHLLKVRNLQGVLNQGIALKNIKLGNSFCNYINLEINSKYGIVEAFSTNIINSTNNLLINYWLNT